MRLTDAAKRTFARHETFHPHYGWFRKAYSVVEEAPGVFTEADAPVRIGVGKNMVRAIRFWGRAAKLIEDTPHSPRCRASSMAPTDFGEKVFGGTGWDQYMEDPGTLWLLHWKLLAPLCDLPVWWLTFNEFHAVEFTEDQLEDAVVLQLEGATTWRIPHRSSIRKDISALLRTYTTDYNSRRIGVDDRLNCPLRELNLIGRSRSVDGYRFNVGPKPTLPSEIVTYAVLDYVARAGVSGNTITIGRLAHDRGTPGNVFKLSESDILDSLRHIVDDSKKLTLTITTGSTQISWDGDPDEIATTILNRYYHEDSPLERTGIRTVTSR